MRLLDQVAQSTQPVIVETPEGSVCRLPGPADHAAAVRSAPMRYVLDTQVRDVCLEICERHADLLDPGDPLMRLPGERLWIEWPVTDPIGRGATQGVLIECSESGRAGEVRSFWENADGNPELAQASVAFDFDMLLSGERPERLGRVGVTNLPVLEGHVLIVIDPAWQAYFNLFPLGKAERVAVATECARQVYDSFAFLLAFIRLLAGRSGLEARPVERAALNAARRARSRPALLDHVEMRLEIGAPPRAGSGTLDHRTPSRRHLVRGHLVRRDGNVFWRSSHYRGDASRLPVSGRTTRVTVAPGYRFNDAAPG